MIKDQTHELLKASDIKPSQTWLPSDGGPSAVVVESVSDGWVQYRDQAGASWEKDAFSFQVRYYLPS